MSHKSKHVTTAQYSTDIVAELTVFHFIIRN